MALNERSKYSLLDKYLGTIFHVINEIIFHPETLLAYILDTTDTREYGTKDFLSKWGK